MSLNDNLKKYFEDELLDSMADVQGEVNIRVKEFIKKLKEDKLQIINDMEKNNLGSSDDLDFVLRKEHWEELKKRLLELEDKLAGDLK